MRKKYYKYNSEDNQQIYNIVDELFMKENLMKKRKLNKISNFNAKKELRMCIIILIKKFCCRNMAQNFFKVILENFQ